jgi:hypothetical protein
MQEDQTPRLGTYALWSASQPSANTWRALFTPDEWQRLSIKTRKKWWRETKFSREPPSKALVEQVRADLQTTEAPARNFDDQITFIFEWRRLFPWSEWQHLPTETRRRFWAETVGTCDPGVVRSKLARPRATPLPPAATGTPPGANPT